MQEYYSNSSNLFNQFTLPFITAIRYCNKKLLPQISKNEASIFKNIMLTGLSGDPIARQRIFECHSSSLDLKHEIVYFDATISS